MSLTLDLVTGKFFLWGYQKTGSVAIEIDFIGNFLTSEMKMHIACKFCLSFTSLVKAIWARRHPWPSSVSAKDSGTSAQYGAPSLIPTKEHSQIMQSQYYENNVMENF